MTRRDQVAVVLAVLGGAAGAFGTLLDWFTISINGISAPGGSATGLDGRDGRTVLAASLVALLAAGAIVVGFRRVTAKFVLLATGAVIAIVAVAGIADATSKDEEVEDEFGIPAERVVVDIGAGLWLVAVSGAALLAGGALVENPN